MNAIFQIIRVWAWKRKYRPGKVLTHFIACDVRRDVEVIDISEIENGIITCKTKTWNVLYFLKGLTEMPPFGEARKVEIKKLWDWPGESWGGPVPETIDHEVG